jgi:Ataxin-3
MRAVEGEWWNFNSLFPAPQPLSRLHLTEFIASLRASGYTIFVVRGDLPQPHPDAGRRDTLGAWFTPEEVVWYTHHGAFASLLFAFAQLFF